MIRKTARGTLPHPCRDVFQVVADVERYPEFVPGWRETRVLERDRGGLRVEQAFGVGPARWRFESTARLEPPRTVRIRSHGGPFRSLSIDWRFDPASAGSGCRVVLEVRADLHTRMLEAVYAPLLERQMDELWEVFSRRVRAVHAA